MTGHGQVCWRCRCHYATDTVHKLSQNCIFIKLSLTLSRNPCDRITIHGRQFHYQIAIIILNSQQYIESISIILLLLLSLFGFWSCNSFQKTVLALDLQFSVCLNWGSINEANLAAKLSLRSPSNTCNQNSNSRMTLTERQMIIIIIIWFLDIQWVWMLNIDCDTERHTERRSASELRQRVGPTIA